MRSTNSSAKKSWLFCSARAIVLLFFLHFSSNARGEAMLQLFNVNWDELTTKMPEIAEAGYTSLWLPPPSKAGSVYSVGYDLFDPFDLGDLNQRGTVRTRYGTKAELQQVVEMAHRFGLRVYFDNIMNHRGFDIPGYNSSAPTNIYPGLTVGDFHLRQQGDGTYRNWDNVSDWGNVWQVQHRPLFGLIDLANEFGSTNENFGAFEGNTAAKPVFVRQPGHNTYYPDTALPAIAGPWKPFNTSNGDPVAEDVNSYLIRAAQWVMAETRCDGFRFDAVKHTPSLFFGDTSATANGYVGAIQTMFDYVHGYGNNVTGNGYVEGDDNRNSCFDAEAVRNDALLFGEHLGEPPSYGEYLSRGMRLVDSPLAGTLNNVLGNPSASLAGLEQRDSGGFSAPNRVMYAQSHDNAFANHRELQLAYMFLREGIPVIYSDGYNQSGAPDYFPRVANASYLGEFGDNKMPEIAYLHHQLARGGTRPRWGDADIVAFERYDYREPGSAADQTVVLFAMNDNYGFPGDVVFVDAEGEGFPAGVNDPPGAGGNHQGLAVGFPPGSVLVQLATSTSGYDRTYKRVTVRNATNSRSVAAGSGGATVYVGGQSIPAGGGAIEILVPSGGYVAYAYQWPEASRASLKDAITFRQNGADAARLTVYRKDGINGDAGFNPSYPFAMRGSIDPGGNVIGGANISNKTYAIDVPIITNAAFDILVRCDASAANTLIKLDGGLDLNSQMNLGPTSGDKRDNRPGAVTDVFLGYEQTAQLFRNGPEKFAARLISRNNVTSAGAETYYYTVGGTNVTINGSGNGASIDTATADWVYHEAESPNTAAGNGTATQRVPLSPTNSQSVDLWVKVGYKFQINKCFIYYTTDGTNPEGSFGTGAGTTKTVAANWVAADSVDSNIDWWKGTIPASNQVNGVQVRYKIALYKDNIGEISDADDAKRFGLGVAGITNFNPTTATVWRHANRNTNDTVAGLSEGFHIARARVFLSRTNKSSVFNTFAQTFYYDAQPPAGAIAFPPTDGSGISSDTYSVVVRADGSVTGVEFNIQDSDAGNDDAVTGQNNANGNTNAVAKFVSATKVTPNDGISAMFPNLPQEWRFDYVLVPGSGTATITVRLHETTTSVFTNRLTILTRTVNTAGPRSIMTISAPSIEGSILVSSATASNLMQACFTFGLTNDPALYNIYTNGVLVPRTNNNYIFSASGCSPGLRSLYYYWVAPPPGTNTFQVTYSNNFFLSATRTFAIARPGDTDSDGMDDYNEILAGTDPQNAASVLRITELANGNQLVVWDSVAGRNYQVLATTNLFDSMQAISQVIQASGSPSFFFDTAPDARNKFYRIQVVP